MSDQTAKFFPLIDQSSWNKAVKICIMNSVRVNRVGTNIAPGDGNAKDSIVYLLALINSLLRLEDYVPILKTFFAKYKLH